MAIIPPSRPSRDDAAPCRHPVGRSSSVRSRSRPRGAMAMIDVIDNFGDFKRLKDNWDTVYEADPEAQFFLSWTWLSQWLPARPHWFILAAKPTQDSRYVAFFPLRLRQSRKRGGMDWASTMRSTWPAIPEPTTPDFYACPTHHRAIPLARFPRKTLKWIHPSSEHSDTDERHCLILADFPPRTFNIAKAERINTADNVNNCRCPLVNLPDDWDSYLKSESTRDRRSDGFCGWSKRPKVSDCACPAGHDRTRRRPLARALELKVGITQRRSTERDG